ncbi:MAG: 2-C-methyl-D-erythritol 4-phosphate cytidylyltransferase [Actinomycetota bacterium]
MRNEAHVCAVLLGAGQGLRAGGKTPKQFLPLAGRPMLVHSLLAFEQTRRVLSVVVVLCGQRPPGLEAAISLPKVRSVVTGGETRQQSLAKGVSGLPPEASIVLVHDAARPLVRPALIERVLDGLDEDHEGAILAVPLEDAVKEVSEEGELLGSRDRGGLWRAQTPQAFFRDPLEDALARNLTEGVVHDDCSALAATAGYRVRVVMGEPSNLKATRPVDLMLCETLLRAWSDPSDTAMATSPTNPAT